MLSAALTLGCIAIVELVVGISVLAFIFFSVQKMPGFSRRRRLAFVALGALLFSPALVPAGTLAVVPLPLGVLLTFVRSSADALFLLKTWWFIVPSMLITGFACSYVAHRFFPKAVLPAQRT